MIKIYGRKSSSNVQVVMWCIAELGLDYQRLDAGIHYGVVNTASYLAINPNATVPTIIDGDYPPMWESAAINRYLSRTYPHETLWPDSPLQQAIVDQWAEWAKLNFGLNFSVPVFWQVVRTPRNKQNPEALAIALKKLHRQMSIADTQLGNNPFIAGNEFSIADLMFGHLLYRYYDIEIERPHFNNISRYYATLTNRPAYREHVMVSYDELRASD
ncbi:glutathione S-transferase [Chromatiales bacterium (ex Bugula neritina AB1)]|nr:glutathione S-transferase [Chromatiales bacterium (ex Bugula neritina AB1)]